VQDEMKETGGFRLSVESSGGAAVRSGKDGTSAGLAGVFARENAVCVRSAGQFLAWNGNVTSTQPEMSEMAFRSDCATARRWRNILPGCDRKSWGGRI